MYLAEIDETTKKVIRVLFSEGTDWPDWAAPQENRAWIETYANVDGVRFAAVGDTYVEDYGYFVGNKPYSSWVLDHDKKTWVAPTPVPSSEDESAYYWVDELTAWVLIQKDD